MPLTKIQFRPGINKELTVYANEGGWASGNNIRFRNGYAEKLGGWATYPIQAANSTPQYIGVARTMHNYVDFNNNNLMAFGTNQKYYIEDGGVYYDITPDISYQVNYLGVTTPTTLGTNPFATVTGSYLVTVTDATFDATIGTWVSFSGVSGGGIVNSVPLNGSFEIVQITSATTYQIIGNVLASATSSGGGAAVQATYQIDAGSSVQSSGSGWGVGPFGLGGWGTAATTGIPLQLWSQTDFNQDLIAAVRTGPIYYWVNSVGTWNSMITINQYANTQVKQTFTTGVSFTGPTTTMTVPNTVDIDIGAYITGAGVPAGTYVTFAGGTTVTTSNTITGTASGTYTFSYAGQTAPTETYEIVNWATYQFVIALGSTPYNPANFNPAFSPLLVRWSDQSNPAEWTPTNSNQSGESYLNDGSFIIGGIATRQEVLIWTDSSLYSMQYIGPPYVFGFTSLMNNISLMSPNAMATTGGVTYWMGVDKFYVYSGTVNTLPCTLRKFIFNNLNLTQAYQVVCGVNERFNEVWWHYPSLNSNINDSYVIYNYLENVWYYGSMNRTAWLDSSLRPFPMAAYSCQDSYLSATINTTQTSFTVYNATSYPASGSLIIGTEQLSYTSISGNTFLGVSRGVNGTPVNIHYAGTPVYNVIPNQLIYHENGVDDLSYPASYGPQPINSYIESSDFAIGDGHHYAFVWRALPDFAFAGSTVSNPQILLTVYPRQNAGTAYQSGVDQPGVTSSSTSPVEQFTGQVYTRVRGRQMAFQINSPNQGVFWQMGSMRFDVRPDGRR